MTAVEIVARARGCIGVRFRAQGRDPALGLDCIGLVAVAIGRAGIATDYSTRSADRARIERGLAAAGLRLMAEPRAGDVALFASGAGQLHLAIVSEDGVIHADAAARRVVERPGPAPWPLLSAWRVMGRMED